MKIDRLLSMILLMLKKKKITASEMAAYFETSLRTIYRDIETLCLAGIPIVSEPGVHGGYSLMEGFTLDKQVFKVDEILALIAGLKGLEAVFDRQSIRQTLEKVESLGKTQETAPVLEIDFFGWGEGNRIRHDVQNLYKSIGQSQCLRFQYTNLNNQCHTRTVEPLKLFYRGNNWYLLGYCRLKEDYRFFRVSRILNLEILKETFIPRESALPEWKPESHLKDDRKPEKLHLRISPGGVSKAREYFSKSNIEMMEDGSIEIRVLYPPDEWVYSYLLSYGEHLTVLQPAGLREELIRRSEVFLNKNKSLTY
ncbi:YafY family protein [Oceanispirochaeta sp.]|jgi:predicted DNA-binding transcriptional regulator YafY|uniref:helix-turn-helix transcriptional regulator n=1 Tax=Oceanispirochaeta sp. TaxID=2035350 RepID=UPI002613FA26|nr:YafY family protein [Oceanispirochaeta sp.]MDA3958189.1 YafY family protein [Oceanispirochaeta sp.]